MIEVEIKVLILDPDRYRRMFMEQGGVYKASFLHEDTYFNMPEGLRDFKTSDEALRIRQSVEFNKNNPKEKKTTHYLTYKGAKLDSSTKTRRELETKVEEGVITKEILILLGFREILTVKKERELYEFIYNEKKVEVLIDYIPTLDHYFIEAEILAQGEEKVEENREILFNFLNQFNITKQNSIRRSYLELIIIELIKRGEFTLK
ncbi:MAG: CYTH domain protein [Promethearchaeota archaeon]|nr:MAG: CYTH domain protein [Candidatus Lokiarchaeota archaeon]